MKNIYPHQREMEYKLGPFLKHVFKTDVLKGGKGG